MSYFYKQTKKKRLFASFFNYLPSSISLIDFSIIERA